MARTLSGDARTKMLNAAAALALEVGIGAFTVNQVSKDSGIPRSTIARHFTSKNELLVAALDELTPVPKIPDTGTLRGDLVDFLTSVAPIFADRKIRALFLDILAGSAREPELAKLNDSMMAKRRGPTQAIFDKAQARGEIAQDIEYEDAFLVFEAPLVMRGLGPPGSLDNFDVELHVDRIIKVLAP